MRLEAERDSHVSDLSKVSSGFLEAKATIRQSPPGYHCPAHGDLPAFSHLPQGTTLPGTEMPKTSMHRDQKALPCSVNPVKPTTHLGLLEAIISTTTEGP